MKWNFYFKLADEAASRRQEVSYGASPLHYMFWMQELYRSRGNSARETTGEAAAGQALFSGAGGFSALTSALVS